MPLYFEVASSFHILAQMTSWMFINAELTLPIWRRMRGNLQTGSSFLGSATLGVTVVLRP